MGAKFVLLELLLALSCCRYVEPSVFTEQFSQNTVELIPCKEQTATVSLYNSTLFTIMANLTLCTNFKEMDTVGFRISTNIFPIESSSSKPVVFTARQSNSDGFVSWNAPLNYNLTSLPNVSHTMCSVKNFTDDNMPLFYVDAFTSSHDTITFTIEVELVQNFVLQTKKTYPIVVGHAAPQIYYYKIPSDVQLVTVETSSLELGCTIVSVQNNTCPVNDLFENVRSKGMYQTMMNSALITINADSIPNREFLLVLVTADHSLCYTNTTFNPDRVINIKVDHMDPLDHYRWAMALPIVVCIVVSLTSFLVCCFYAPRCVPRCILRQQKCKCCFWFDLSEDDGSEQHVGNSEEEKLIGGSNINYGTTGEGRQTRLSTEEQELPSSTHASEGKKEDDQNVNGKSKEDVLDQRNMRDGQSQGDQKNENNQKPYRAYSWITVTVGIFYALPAVQLVYSEQLILDRGGDQDTCYYNFKCAHPVGSISAFNNIWSNIGYVFLGFVFNMIVMFRHFQYYVRKSKDKNIDKYGVQQFFGIYYAMGFALMLEGCMSALYHICPSNANFQFDTAFMFITAGIILVKVYQNRHPNVQANAFIAFFAFAVIILFTVIGIYNDVRHPIFVKVAFFFVTLIIVLIFLGQFYKWNITGKGGKCEKILKECDCSFHLSWKCANLCAIFGLILLLIKSMCFCKECWKHHKHRIGKHLIIFICNVLLGIIVCILKVKIATAILIFFVANIILYLFIYCVIKFWYGEPWTWLNLLFFVLLVVAWGGAYHFYGTVTQWADTPAMSRTQNKPCIVEGFYDAHDVWHFLSACGMFFAFLFVLVIDDGVMNVKRETLLERAV